MRTRDELLPIFERMEEHGGGFVSALASAWFKADPRNQRRIQDAFPDYIDDYAQPLGAHSVNARGEKI